MRIHECYFFSGAKRSLAFSIFSLGCFLFCFLVVKNFERDFLPGRSFLFARINLVGELVEISEDLLKISQSK